MQTKFSVTVGDLVEAAGIQVPLYRPVFLKFPDKINGHNLEPVISLSGLGAKQWEFDVWQLRTNNLSRKHVHQLPILLTRVSVDPLRWNFEKGEWANLDRFGFSAMNPGMHVCNDPECGFSQRFTKYEQSRYSVNGKIPCRSGQGCHGFMVFIKAKQTEGVPEDVVTGLRDMYAKGARPELTCHPPEIYMVIANPAKVEWIPVKRIGDIRAGYNNEQPYRDIIPWKFGKQSGEKPVGAITIIPEKSQCLGWAAEDILFGHRDQGYKEQFIYVPKEYTAK